MKHLLLLFFVFPTLAWTQITDTTYCNDIVAKFDEFDKKTTWHSRLYEGVGLTKGYIADTVEVMILFVSIKRDEPFPLAKGVKILFEDGTVVSYADAKVKSDYAQSEFRAQSTFAISKRDYPTFSTKKIKGFRLHVYDMKTDSGERFMHYFNCLRAKKN